MKAIIILLCISTMIQDNSPVIYDFKNANSTSGWNVVDDGVMGGLSQGNLSINDEGNGRFHGFVTTENNGGFSSIRHDFKRKNVSEYKHIIIKVKGDGKDYQFRIKEKSSQRYSYITTFETTGEWQTIKLPLSSFYPSFRGYTLNKPNFAGDEMEEIAILIGNKKKEAFSLEIESILLE